MPARYRASGFSLRGQIRFFHRSSHLQTSPCQGRVPAYTTEWVKISSRETQPNQIHFPVFQNNCEVLRQENIRMEIKFPRYFSDDLDVFQPGGRHEHRFVWGKPSGTSKKSKGIISSDIRYWRGRRDVKKAAKRSHTRDYPVFQNNCDMLGEKGLEKRFECEQLGYPRGKSFPSGGTWLRTCRTGFVSASFEPC